MIRSLWASTWVFRLWKSKCFSQSKIFSSFEYSNSVVASNRLSFRSFFCTHLFKMLISKMMSMRKIFSSSALIIFTSLTKFLTFESIARRGFFLISVITIWFLSTLIRKSDSFMFHVSFDWIAYLISTSWKS